jgi:hypothetical protein
MPKVIKKFAVKSIAGLFNVELFRIGNVNGRHVVRIATVLAEKELVVVLAEILKK